MEKLDVLIVGAHPDDAEIGCGGLIAKCVDQGYQVGILDLTNGEPTPYGSVEIRLREAKTAAKILGVKLRKTLDLPNRLLTNTLENRLKISEYFREVQPKIIITHPSTDWHPDHIACHQLVNAAKFHAQLSKTESQFPPFSPQRIFYFHHTHQKQKQSIDFLVDISEYISQKIQALEAYKSQFIENPKNRKNIHEITQKAAYFGSLIKTQYAEGFESPEYLHIDNIFTI